MAPSRASSLVLAHGLAHALPVDRQVVLGPIHAGCALRHENENIISYLSGGRIRGRQFTRRQILTLVVGEPLNNAPRRVILVPPVFQILSLASRARAEATLKELAMTNISPGDMLFLDQPFLVSPSMASPDLRSPSAEVIRRNSGGVCRPCFAFQREQLAVGQGAHQRIDGIDAGRKSS